VADDSEDFCGAGTKCIFRDSIERGRKMGSRRQQIFGSEPLSLFCGAGGGRNRGIRVMSSFFWRFKKKSSLSVQVTKKGRLDTAMLEAVPSSTVARKTSRGGLLAVLREERR
jgi:hypothetical protein